MVQREVADRFFAAAGNEGVRRGLRPRPARRGAHRLPPGLAHRLPAAAERRLGARRVPAPAAARALRGREARGRGGVRPPPQDPPELARARGRRVARAQAAEALAALGRPADTRAEALAPERVRRAGGSCCGDAGWLAPAKINLALVVGPPRPGGKHEVTTVLQRVGLADRIDARAAPAGSRRRVRGRHARPRRARSCWPRRPAPSAALGASGSRSEIPVAAGLGGGSSDAAAALLLANGTLDRPLRGRAPRRRSRPVSAPTCRSSSPTGPSSARATDRADAARPARRATPSCCCFPTAR